MLIDLFYRNVSFDFIAFQGITNNVSLDPCGFNVSFDSHLTTADDISRKISTAGYFTAAIALDVSPCKRKYTTQEDCPRKLPII